MQCQNISQISLQPYKLINLIESKFKTLIGMVTIRTIHNTTRINNRQLHF